MSGQSTARAERFDAITPGGRLGLNRYEVLLGGGGLSGNAPPLPDEPEFAAFVGGA
jgi:hypothetical protein